MTIIDVYHQILGTLLSVKWKGIFLCYFTNLQI